jgi:hypothetical protein
MVHGFFYAANAASGTSVITETHSLPVGNGVFDWAHFYNVNTTSSGFVDNSSCKTGVTPSNNTAPNISGTAYTTGTNGDLILTCIYVEQNPFGNPNPITSITWPAGFTGLSEETTYGHACAYGVQTAAGAFTPTFTVAQSTHNSFTIMSAAFKAGSGGRAPGSGASIVLSEMHYVGSNGQTNSVNLPCPSGTTSVVVLDDAGSLNTVTDSDSNAWSHVSVPGNYWGPIYYTNSPTITNANSYAVTMAFGDTGGEDLVGLFCVTGTGGVDTAATAQNGSTLDAAGSGATYSTGNLSDSTVSNVSSTGTSATGDLVFDVGVMGVGPVDSCITGHCVFDYVGSTSWSNGDNESYANGDLMAHAYAGSAGTVSFNFNVGSGTSGTASGISLALKPGSAPCSYTLTPTTRLFAAGGGATTVTVTASTGCAWTATTNAPAWITLQAGGVSGNGNGSFVYSVVTNLALARLGTITVGNESFVVMEGGLTSDVPFTDVLPSDPYFDYVSLMSSYGITVGCLTSPPEYCPTEDVTRAEMAVFIVRGIDIATNATLIYPTTAYFGDVPAFGVPDSEYFDYVQRIAQLGITVGCQTSPPLYCPDESISQGEMAVFVIRAWMFVTTGNATATFTYPPTPYFTDVPATDEYFAYIQKMAQLGFWEGCTATTYCESSAVTRDQMAPMIIRAMLGAP